MEKKPQYALQLTLKNLWIVIVSGMMAIGSAFGTGVTVQKEISKVEAAKEAQICLGKINCKDMELLESNRKQKENLENMLFFQNQYIIYKDRLEKCITDDTFSKAL